MPVQIRKKSESYNIFANSFAKDAFGMQLEYFPGDYNRTGSNVTSISTGQTAYYNGNVNGISWQSYKPSIVVSNDPTGTIQAPAMYTYTYDPKYQYNQSVWGAPNYSTNTFMPSSTNSFQEGNILYDANGNIQTMAHTDQAGNPFDNFLYNYNPNTNQLASVANGKGQPPYGTYTYDETGRLTSQTNAGGPTYLKYDVTGKITGIYSDATFNHLIIGYTYDESGNRISSVNNTGSQPITTYYVYDASGNVLAIYTQSGSGTPQLAEQPVYGSSRLGTYYTQANNYVYEIRDNVGSVRVAINRRLNSSGQADIYTYNDYYPFGSNLGRNGGSTYRYDYQGAYSEKDQITTYNNFELRMYDSRIGRWLSTDPAGQFASPYEGMGNNPVMESDPTGGDVTDFYKNLTTGQVTWIDGSANIAGWKDIGDANFTFTGEYLNTVVISSTKIDNTAHNEIPQLRSAINWFGDHFYFEAKIKRSKGYTGGKLSKGLEFGVDKNKIVVSQYGYDTENGFDVKDADKSNRSNGGKGTIIGFGYGYDKNDLSNGKGGFNGFETVHNISLVGFANEEIKLDPNGNVKEKFSGLDLEPGIGLGQLGGLEAIVRIGFSFHYAK